MNHQRTHNFSFFPMFGLWPIKDKAFIFLHFVQLSGNVDSTALVSICCSYVSTSRLNFGFACFQNSTVIILDFGFYNFQTWFPLQKLFQFLVPIFGFKCAMATPGSFHSFPLTTHSQTILVWRLSSDLILLFSHLYLHRVWAKARDFHSFFIFKKFSWT